MIETGTISVVLADDHESVRRGIRDLLKKAPDIRVIGEAASGREAIVMVENLHPHVLLLDIEMPGMTGIEVTRRLREKKNLVNILILSAYDDNEYIREVLANGASGYIVKGEAPTWVVEAVRGVAQGQRGWVSSRIAAKLRAMQPGDPPQMTMTYRELELLRMCADHRSNEEMLTRLHMTPDSLMAHLQMILNKLGVETWEEAVLLARREGWI